MIEGIAGIGPVTAFTPSAAHGRERRQKRLKWLSSLRAALDEAGSPIGEIDVDGARIGFSRAQIADALGVAEDMRAWLGDDGQREEKDVVYGRTVTAGELAKRIAASADRSLAVQAHVSAASVRRYVVGHEEDPR